MGDTPGLSYVREVKFFVDQGFLSKCNSARRYNVDCFNLSSKSAAYTSMMDSKTLFENYAAIVGNDACTQATFTCFYWHQCFGIAVAAALLTLLM
jgi:hypothetical protein